MNHILKYNLKSRGLNLEKTNPHEAITYYIDLKNHKYFIWDYFPYRRLVLMYEKIKDNEKKTDIIKEFFKSGIYCNNHNFLWLKFKLQKLKDEKFTTQSEIDYLCDYFKNNSIKNKNKSNTPLPIADRIRKNKGEIIVESEKSYNRREKQYEYEVKLSILNYQKEYIRYIDLLNYMIDGEGYKRYIYFKKLCIAYRKLKDSESELKVIERYFNRESTHTKASDKWFKKRLDDLKSPNITFNLEGVDLSKNPFYEYNRKLDMLDNLKRKCVLIEYGKTLDGSDAITYYKYLCNNTYFKNDWYPYRQLTMIYDEINDYNANLVNIKKLLQSKIYLNEYQFLWFSDKIRVLIQKTDIDEETVKKWFDEYEIYGSVNKFKLNKFLADKIINKNDIITVLKDDEFNHIQEKLALKEKGCIYERVSNFELAITHYVKIINDREFNYLVFHNRLCACLMKIKDYLRLKKGIDLYFTKPPIDRTARSDEYFSNCLKKLNKMLI